MKRKQKFMMNSPAKRPPKIMLLTELRKKRIPPAAKNLWITIRLHLPGVETILVREIIPAREMIPVRETILLQITINPKIRPDCLRPDGNRLLSKILPTQSVCRNSLVLSEMNQLLRKDSISWILKIIALNTRNRIPERCRIITIPFRLT